MPMVTESSLSPTRTYRTRKNAAYSSLTLPNGRTRSQWGFRSGPLSAEEVAALSANSKAGNVVSLIAQLDDDYESPAGGAHALAHSSRAWQVHDRDYTETTYRPTGFNYSVNYETLYNGQMLYQPFAMSGAMGITGLTTGFMPSLASTSVQQSIAAQMLRESRPPEKGFDLARFAGEQREASLLFRASNYFPTSRKDAAGAFLNYMFGLKPTGSDLGKMAELVLRSDMPIRTLLAAEKVREKKYRRRTLMSDGGQGVVVLTTSGTPADYTYQCGSMMCRAAYLIPISGSVSNGNMLKPVLSYSYVRNQTIRTFATWEYFIPQPAEISSRLDFYKEKSRQILGASKITEATVYELTPWTWLGNWFIDIGGLLRYQRAVVDNQIVASACGYSTWEEYTGIVSYAEQQVSPYASGVNPNWKPFDVKFNPATTSIRWRRHVRRGGNPYSIMPTWSMNNQRWAILGALGLARGAGVAVKQ